MRKWTCSCSQQYAIVGKCDSTYCQNIQHIWPTNAHERRTCCQ